MAIERLEISVFALLARRSNGLSYRALNITLLSFALLTVSNYYNGFKKILAIERLELSIFALVAGRSNRLSYRALNITLLSFGLLTVSN